MSNKLTTILNAIYATCKKMLPAYNIFKGERSETIRIAHGTFDGNPLPLDDTGFTGFVLGEVYSVTINGVTKEYEAQSIDGLTVIMDISEANIGWALALSPEDSTGIIYEAADSYVNAEISISQTKIIREREIKKLSEDLLPDTFRKKVDESYTAVRSSLKMSQNAQEIAVNAENKASEAIVTANNATEDAITAVTTAENAQTTAENAQTTANGAITKAETAVSQSESSVKYVDQSLTPEEQNIARKNINTGHYECYIGKVEKSVRAIRGYITPMEYDPYTTYSNGKDSGFELPFSLVSGNITVEKQNEDGTFGEPYKIAFIDKPCIHAADAGNLVTLEPAPTCRFRVDDFYIYVYVSFLANYFNGPSIVPCIRARHATTSDLSHYPVTFRVSSELWGATVPINKDFIPKDLGLKASPGQFIVVKSVDENGAPTEWEALPGTISKDLINAGHNG